MIEIKPPETYSDRTKELSNMYNAHSIFLAGSIEMGAAENWQQKVVKSFKNYENVVILNPRRDNRGSSWKQTKSNKHFRQQVEWELTHLESADKILFYFDPNTISPVSMLGLGLFGTDFNTYVYVACPKGFHLKGNIDIICERYSIPLYTSLNAAIKQIKLDIDRQLDDEQRDD